ncbi:MAG: nucleotide exchange factor GrpE [Candidatus Moranbacteria bacterium RIFOXYB1_FULL_43_19]|nr:MAG: nucleotide exchange factor GrpE [Candidatus Moranbacteria bacterium RIFOXYA1_FULL_44_7]OGI28060.1 MAG: nucleotide exchange factor GrpE [Candidatus Moranbacteria bacterium RIFOXYB1_FULL_43_19]OGI34124.1 MAG: nucleotide exchange factor GrpE [Candidatus Moranbacteria bacterium RIFOXYC1_FULL_44_13]OGI37972.1 MAG: nucleotide exchange factor GrpE [Candidatus Moranbacteria bacterium RIFOXYD1_FULL_44_12]
MQKKDRYKVLLAQKVLFYDRKQDKFLVVKVKNKEGWYYKNMGPWEFPGGGFDEAEILEKSLKREIQEEVGTDIEYKILDIVHVNDYTAPSGHKIVLVHLADYFSGEIVLSEEHDEYEWISPEEIEKSKEYKNWLKFSVLNASKYIEKESALDSWKRCQADFENYKKSQARAQEEFTKFAKMDIISQILPVLDNFEASLAHVPAHSRENKWVEGIVYIKKQLEDIFKNNNIEEIEVKAGDKFDPEVHEAVGGDGKKQKVAKIIQKGYRMNGRILRAVRVEVN